MLHASPEMDRLDLERDWGTPGVRGRSSGGSSSGESVVGVVVVAVAVVVAVPVAGAIAVVAVSTHVTTATCKMGFLLRCTPGCVDRGTPGVGCSRQGVSPM